MTDPDVKRGERIAEQIQAATWYTDQYLGTIIWARNPLGFGDDFRVADIRGWGHLTGQGALRMGSSAAEITQMALATHIVNCHNNRADLAAERERDANDLVLRLAMKLWAHDPQEPLVQEAKDWLPSCDADTSLTTHESQNARSGDEK